MMVASVFFYEMEERTMAKNAKNKDYIDVLLSDFLETNTGSQPQADKMIAAARKLRTAISRGDADCSEQIADLEYAAIRNGFYAGFLAAKGIFMA